jgi:hypothetical protein
MNAQEIERHFRNQRRWNARMWRDLWTTLMLVFFSASSIFTVNILGTYQASPAISVGSKIGALSIALLATIWTWMKREQAIRELDASL